MKVFLLFLITSTIGCDQVSKQLVSTHLMGVPRQSFLGDMLRLEYAENRGGFLSRGEGLPPALRTALFTVGTGVILAACFVVALQRGWPNLAGFALLIGGGVSNLVDRVSRGSVVDFLNVGIGPLRTGIFNLADMAVLCGIALLLVRRAGRVTADEGAA
jgi:signal peptidase II